MMCYYGHGKKTYVTTKLISPCCYEGMDNVEFPVEVTGFMVEGSSAVYVDGDDLIRVGADPEAFEPDFPYCFRSYEVV